MIEHIEHTTMQVGDETHVVVRQDVFQDLLRMAGSEETIPHEVVSAVVDGASPIKAWREHKKFTQDEMAYAMEISQPGYAQIEAGAKPRKKTLQKVADALGISVGLLDI